MDWQKKMHCYRCEKITEWKRGRTDFRQLCCQSCGTYEFKNDELALKRLEK